MRNKRLFAFLLALPTVSGQSDNLGWRVDAYKPDGTALGNYSNLTSPFGMSVLDKNGGIHPAAAALGVVASMSSKTGLNPMEAIPLQK